MSDTTDRAALIAEMLSHVTSLRDHYWETAADVLERAADALADAEQDLAEARLPVTIAQCAADLAAMTPWSLEQATASILMTTQLQQKVTEQAALILAIEVTVRKSLTSTRGTGN